jgi:hypothetical protein
MQVEGWSGISMSEAFLMQAGNKRIKPVRSSVQFPDLEKAITADR